MSILVKAGAGLAAGVVAGALGLMLVPRLEPSVVKPRNAVEKPQFVAATTAPAAATQPKATLAVAVETPAAKPTNPPKPLMALAPPTPDPAVAPSPVPAPSPLAAQTPAAKSPSVAKVEPPAPVASPPASLVAAQTPVAKPTLVAKAEAPTPVSAPPAPSAAAPPPSAPASAQASPDAARWSVRGLVALARGDISSARLFLARAAEAGDARAWVALADTYDPAMLTKFGVVFAPGDPQRAKDCLVKAVAAGVVVPKDRLAALDQGERQVR